MSRGAGLDARLRAAIRTVDGFPRPGIAFLDVTPLLADAALFAEAVAAIVAPFRGAGVTHVAAVESRGFLFGAAAALELRSGVLPVRKRGKLPRAAFSAEYALEYGTNALEIHRDACEPDARVLVVDDVLATGGTARAARSLVEQAGGTVVGVAVLIEIAALGGRSALGGRVASVLEY